MLNSNSASFWLDHPVLVTGATGFVGSWLVKRLLSLRANVICLVRDWTPESELFHTQTIEKVTLVRGSIDDQFLLERILGEYKIRTVFHLAAQAIVEIANANPLSTFETNIRGTWLLLEACRHSTTIQHIIVASSDKAYGEQPNLPYDERMPLQGKHPYDVSKSCADLLAHTYAATYGLPTAITRCGNIFGGGDLNWNRLVPGTVRSLLRSERPIIRSDGSFVRDYLYVEDVIDAYVLLAEALSMNQHLRGEAFNFSYAQPQTALEMVQRIISMMDIHLTPDVRNEAKNEIQNQYLNATKAKQLLHWSPRFSLEKGLHATIEWYRANLNRPH